MCRSPKRCLGVPPPPTTPRPFSKRVLTNALAAAGWYLKQVLTLNASHYRMDCAAWPSAASAAAGTHKATDTRHRHCAIRYTYGGGGGVSHSQPGCVSDNLCQSFCYLVTKIVTLWQLQEGQSRRSF